MDSEEIHLEAPRPWRASLVQEVKTLQQSFYLLFNQSSRPSIIGSLLHHIKCVFYSTGYELGLTQLPNIINTYSKSQTPGRRRVYRLMLPLQGATTHYPIEGGIGTRHRGAGLSKRYARTESATRYKIKRYLTIGLRGLSPSSQQEGRRGGKRHPIRTRQRYVRTESAIRYKIKRHSTIGSKGSSPIHNDDDDDDILSGYEVS